MRFLCRTLQKTLAKQPGVAEAEVNLGTGKARVSGSQAMDPAGLQGAIDRIGYQLLSLRPRPSVSAPDEEQGHVRSWLRR